MSLPQSSVDETGGDTEAPVVPQTRGRALLGPLVGIAIGALIIAFSQTIAVPDIEGGFSPRWWPQVTGAAVLLFSLAAAVKDGIRPRGANEDVDAGSLNGSLRVGLVFVAVAVYGVGWYFFDFRVVTLLLLVALVAIGGGRGWKGMIVFPVVVTLVLWLVFGLALRVPL